MAKLTMIGMNRFDPTLFDGLTFPAGIDKALAVNEILIRSGEFEVLYPQPDFLKMQIEMWGKKHFRTFEKWVEALAENFNPLYNYDRHEEYTDEKSGKSSGLENTSNVSDATTKTDGTRSQASNEVASTSNSSENEVSAYDSATYAPHDQNTGSGTQSTAGTVGETSGTESTSNGASNTTTGRTQEDAETIKHTAHLYGNIGVTTSTQMLEDFLRVERFCIYEQIADIFVDEFCIMIY